MPHSTFNERKYEKAEGITLKAMHQLKRTKLPSFFDKISFGQSQIHRIMMTVNPSPTGKKNHNQLLRDMSKIACLIGLKNYHKVGL